MSSTVQRLRARWYPFGPDPLKEGFFGLISERLRPGIRILDIGCGRGTIYPFPWNKYPDKYLVGIDPDPSAVQNPYVDEFVVLSSEADQRQWPLADGMFDLVIARFVLEHVTTPLEFLENVRRVLKPGGEFLFSTPNRLHPALIASRLLPHAAKQRILGATLSTDAADIFPAFYRMNTANDIRRTVANCGGFEITGMKVGDSGPIGYLDFSLPTFLVAAVYYELTKRLQLERHLGSSITGILKKL